MSLEVVLLVGLVAFALLIAYGIATSIDKVCNGVLQTLDHMIEQERRIDDLEAALRDAEPCEAHQ